ncbi:MAG TPA: ornithine carbamoyltransferase [Anaeromyxobacteraceae bacterium]|nr:ornithine carbamoyltransferase [Anaeromyxobacteraceae bacterium]
MARAGKTKRDFLRVTDLSREELLELIERAAEWKLLGKNGPRPLERMSIGLIFEKASTRTRVSFQVGVYQLGGNSLTLSPQETQLGRGEPIKDTARVLARYLDALVLRTFEHAKLEEMAHRADVPVVNALTDSSHPCQVLADLLTVTERFGTDALRRADLDVAWIGDGNNMANSWLEACSALGFRLRLACPEEFDPDPALLAKAGAKARLVRDPREAVRGAHVVNTDVWASMGQEAQAAERQRRFTGFTVDRALMALADPKAMVMHCLPAHRGEEITDDVIEGSQSAVLDEAENRLHAQKALLELLLA